MRKTTAVGGSFRDPSGTVYTKDGVLYREIAPDYESHWIRLVDKGLLRDLQAGGYLVPHDEVGRHLALSPSTWKVIRPEAVPFVSYPWEWCFGELKAAALLTLAVQRISLAKGFALKDASAFNVQFHHARPVLIDTLSFEPYVDGSPWVAYRQFCEHFLAPLLLMSQVDPRLGRMSQEHVDGIPLDLASSMLPARTRWRPGIALHIHWHAAAIRKHAGDRTPDARLSAMVSRTGLLGLIDSLETLISRLDCRVSGSEWCDYEETHGYAAEARAAKERLVVEMAGAQPGVVWDLGANTGRFSELLAPAASHVVAMDRDHGAVERHWRRRLEHGADILPLVMDLTAPSPGVGWALQERDSLAARGPADTLLALALVHHLGIGNNIPLSRLAAWLAETGRRVIVEWVPKSDPQCRRLLVARKDVFDQYHQEGFEHAMAEWFRTVARATIPGTERLLYCFERITR